MTGNGTTWKILRSSDGQTNIVTLGSINERPVQADYNGDGFADPEIYDYFTAEWRGNVAFADPFGWSEAIPVPGDYNGDGLADRAVYYPAGGQWYVQLAGSNALMTGGPMQWGWSEAIPALSFPYIPVPNPQVIGNWTGVIRSRGRIYSFSMNFPIDQPGTVYFTNSDGCEYLANGAAVYGLEGDASFSLVQSRNSLRGTITNPPGFARGVYAVKLIRTR